MAAEEEAALKIIVKQKNELFEFTCTEGDQMFIFILFCPLNNLVEERLGKQKQVNNTTQSSLLACFTLPDSLMIH